MSAREVERLTGSVLVDGCRGLQKPNARETRSASAISQRMRSLFFAGRALEGAADGRRRPQAVCQEPPIYIVPHFLTARELDHLDERITSERRRFKRSHTDGREGDGLVVDERTSISLALPKAADATLRAIEGRAAELVGLPADHVEPLQVVHYSHGALFDLHHDVAPIRIKGDHVDDDSASATASASDGGSGTTNAAGGAERCTGAKAIACVSDTTLRNEAPAYKDGPLTASDVVVETQDGPRRLVTLFVYLNTLPEGVGHTEFPLLCSADGQAVSVRPRCGTALLFCNVDERGEPDARLCHRACPVPEGHVKFGVNIWITDVSQQAHAVDAPPPRTRPAGSKSMAAGGRGLLAPLLFRSGISDPTDLAPPPPAALVGLRVSRTFPEHGTFTGTVTEHAPTLGYHLEYSDGDEEDVGVDDLLALPLADPTAIVGRRIGRHFPGHGRFEGEVVAWEHDHRGYRLRYDDGDEESEIPAAEVLRLLLPFSSATGSKAAAAARRKATKRIRVGVQ